MGGGVFGPPFFLFLIMAGIKFFTQNRDYSSVIPITGIVEFLRIPFPTGEASTEVNLIRDAACRIVEDRTGYILRTTVLEVYLDRWRSAIRIPYGPNFSVTTVTYYDALKVVQTMPSTDYSVDDIASPSLVQFHEFPTLQDRGFNSVKLTCTVGAGTAEGDIPEALHAAVKILCGHLYENRQEVITGTIATQIPQGADALINPYRIL